MLVPLDPIGNCVLEKGSQRGALYGNFDFWTVTLNGNQVGEGRFDTPDQATAWAKKFKPCKFTNPIVESDNLSRKIIDLKKEINDQKRIISDLQKDLDQKENDLAKCQGTSVNSGVPASGH